MKSILLISILLAVAYCTCNSPAYVSADTYQNNDIVLFDGCCFEAHGEVNPGIYPLDENVVDYPWGPWLPTDFECNHDPDCTDAWNEYVTYPIGSSVCVTNKYTAAQECYRSQLVSLGINPEWNHFAGGTWVDLVGHGCIKETNNNGGGNPITPPGNPAGPGNPTPPAGCVGFTGTPIGAYDPEYSADNDWIGNYQGGDIVTYEGCEFEAEWDTIQPPSKYYVSDWTRSPCCVVNCANAQSYSTYANLSVQFQPGIHFVISNQDGCCYTPKWEVSNDISDFPNNVPGPASVTNSDNQWVQVACPPF